MSESPLDVFVVARPDHPLWLGTTIESVRRYLQPSPTRITIVTHDGTAGLDGRAVLGFGPANVPVVKTIPAERRETCFRQFLKWGLAGAARSGAYMVLEAGELLQAQCHVLQGERYALARERLYHFPDYRMHNWLFGMYPPPGGWFVPPLMVYDKAVIAAMNQLIEARYAKIRWCDAVLNILNQLPDMRFSAAQVYGGYLESFQGGRLTSRPVRHVRLPNDAFGQPHAQIADVISYDSPDPPVGTTPVLRMSSLGVNGRFGNQIFQYGFLRLLAQQRRMEPQCPPWVGASLFGHKERWATEPLPLWSDGDGSLDGELDRTDPAPGGAELWGYFQFHTSFYSRRRADFEALFQPISALAVPLQDAVAKLRGGGKTLVGVHLRRGDHAGGDFWPAPSEWYVRWLEEIWPSLNEPVLFLASDDPNLVVGDFARFNPRTSADLGVNLKGAEFYPDFFALTKCDILAISNSTFSYAAAMLNRTAGQFMRPQPEEQRLVRFDPWDSPVLLSRKMAA